MTEREKLLKILDTHITPRERLNPLEAVTDYLLDSGVVVLPCKIGDTVFEIGGSRNYEIVELKIKNIIFDTNGVAFDDAEIGKTIFLTREEAEKALKEAENNDKAKN